jgi:prevent-host-death family protein
MKTVTIKDAKNRLSELAREAESGETIIVTRNGKPVFDIVAHQPRKGGLNFEALERWKRTQGVGRMFGDVPPDFDDPLPEDFLLQPVPE